ncbi:MAG: NADH:ubiquinone reductase (Na(+)-transporting) subunit C [Bacteroidales bacterium]|nr:NADH:ubiquinone reductase (Na(+)-transporting) subunit C [Bacteroidales bacterium]
MNTNSNTYTIIYTTVLVVVVAAILALVAMALKPRQTANVELEQMKSIMLAANIGETNGQPDKKADFKKLYEQHITETYVIDGNGNKVSGVDAFGVDLKSQYNAIKNGGELTLPVYKCKLDNGNTVTILPCYGAGLWGAIWGYLSVEEDGSTLHGAMFAHASETPGLGGEIAEPWFYNQFDGKSLKDAGAFSSVKIVKGGAGNDRNGVDAISGATITSRSLQNTIEQWMNYYKLILGE